MLEEDPSHHKKTGIWMLIAAWVLFLTMATILYNDWFFKPKASTLMTSDGLTLIIEKNHQGHFFVEGAINQQQVVFMLDTGATFVAIPKKIATRSQLTAKRPITISTANGLVKAHTTRINTLTIGPFNLNNVKAVIMPDNDGTVLLGMSALKHFNLEQTPTQLIMKPAH